VTAATHEVKNAVCTYCGCVCDDIDLTVEGDRITRARRACILGEAWFLNHKVEAGPEAFVDGRPATVAEAVAVSARILAASRMPLIFGLSNTTTEAQRLSVELADLTGASIDTTTSVCHGPTELAVQQVGKSACTLGEVRSRADLVIYWGANPAEGHPRHMTRYALTPKGKFIPNGRKDRTLVVIDVRRTPTVRAADLFLQIKPGKDFELAHILRAAVRGIALEPEAVAATGLSVAEVQDLAVRMKQARFGVILFGMGLSMTRGKHANSANLFLLAADLNAYTKFIAMPMRGHGNVTGADTVLTWQSGYPFAVNYSRGYPRFNPGEFTAVDLLARGEADAAVIVASDPGANFPAAARDRLAAIATIVLDPKNNETTRLAKVHFVTAPYGISAPGTVYRMDEVPLALRPALPSTHPTDEAVLAQIVARVKELAYA
jgi:formylmethanofuran dehydrogenase subunit B